MKKKLAFLLLSVSITTIAQVQIPQEYSINKPLRLETVNPGSVSDSVLVRGTDKTIKFIPRSEFGGGGSQNLQQTIDNGGSATFNSGNQTVSIFDGSSNDVIFYSLDSEDAGTYNNMYFSPSIFSIESNYSTLAATSYFQINQGQIEFRQYGPPGTGRTTLVFQEPIGNSTLRFPAKTGSHVLATLDDITGGGGTQTLQQTLDNGSIGIVSDSSIFLQAQTTLDDNKGVLSLQQNESFFRGVGPSISSEVRIEQGNMYLSNLNTIESGKLTTVLFDDPISVTNLKFPSKPTDGVYTLATLDDIIDGGGSGVQSVSGDIVDNTDPSNPVIVTPTLKEVIAKEPVTTLTGGSQYITLETSAGAGAEIAGYTIYNGAMNMTTGSTAYSRSSTIGLTEGDLTISKNSSTSSDATFIKINEPVALTTLKFPAKTIPDTYIIATEPKAYTVATLPAGTVGDMAYVTDATAPTYLGTLTGGGSVVCPVFYNGTAWVAN